MTEEIAEKYGIHFRDEIDDGEIDKSANSDLGHLDLLLFECSLRDIDDDTDDMGLLSQIDEALSNPDSEIHSGCGIVDILIYQDVVKFYVNDDIDEMPTADFREIIAGWREFLLTPPLNGTKIKLSLIDRFKKLFNK